MRCGIALGSNQGDRQENLREAVRALRKLDRQPEQFLLSPVYETEPVDCEPGAAGFLNAVAEIEFDRLPVALLDAMKAVEQELGRPSKRPRNSPRTIDLDVLYAGNLTLANEEIVIPHPRLHQRRFVLAPLCDIRPDLILPGRNETVADLLARLPVEPRAVRVDTVLFE